MKKVLLLLLINLSAIQPTLLIAAPQNAAFKVGAILPLSGEGSALGDSLKNGMEMALADLPGYTSKYIQISYEDDLGVNRNSIVNFKKLLAAGCNVFICVAAQPCLALAPLAEAAKVTLVGTAVPKKIVEGRKYVFLFLPLIEDVATRVVDEAKRHGYKRVARITTIHDGRQAMKSATTERSRGTIEYPIDEEYPGTEKDFRTFLTKVRKTPDIDAIYVNLFLGQIGLFAKQTRELGIKLPLFSSELFRDPAERRVANGALENQWYVDQRSPSASFTNNYLQRFPNASLSNAPNGYDFINLLHSAERSGTTPEHLNQFLSQVSDINGAFGKYSASGDNRFTIPVEVKIVRGNDDR